MMISINVATMCSNK